MSSQQLPDACRLGLCPSVSSGALRPGASRKYTQIKQGFYSLICRQGIADSKNRAFHPGRRGHGVYPALAPRHIATSAASASIPGVC